MKFSGIFKGKEEKKEDKREKERELDNLLRKSDIKLRMLYNNYKLILERELIVARGNKKKSIQNQDNYAKIGIAYYSMLLINRAQEKMDEMKSYRSLYNCINDLNEVLSTINNLDRKMGKVNVKKTVSSLKKMSSSSGGSSKDLKKAYDSLRTQEESMPGEEEKNTGVDSLVSVEVIEKLINGVDVEDCVRNGEGIEVSPENIMDEFSDSDRLKAAMEFVSDEEDDLSDLDKMKSLLDSM